MRERLHMGCGCKCDSSCWFSRLVPLKVDGGMSCSLQCQKISCDHLRFFTQMINKSMQTANMRSSSPRRWMFMLSNMLDGARNDTSPHWPCSLLRLPPPGPIKTDHGCINSCIWLLDEVNLVSVRGLEHRACVQRQDRHLTTANRFHRVTLKMSTVYEKQHI